MLLRAATFIKLDHISMAKKIETMQNRGATEVSSNEFRPVVVRLGSSAGGIHKHALARRSATSARWIELRGVTKDNE